MKKVTNPPPESWDAIIERPSIAADQLDEIITGVFNQVQSDGDAALIRLTEQFDGVQLNNLAVSELELEEAAQKVCAPLKQAITRARQNIETFNKSQAIEPTKIETSPGVV